MGVARSLAIGIATGARSSLGLVPSALGSGRTGVITLAVGLVIAEMTVDKLPVAGSRLDRGPLLGRLGLGAVGAVALARHQCAGVVAPAVVGTLGAAAGSFGGWWVRDLAATRGWTWQVAVLEDGTALALTALAWRGSR